MVARSRVGPRALLRHRAGRPTPLPLGIRDLAGRWEACLAIGRPVLRWSPDALLPGATREANGQVMPTEIADGEIQLRTGDVLQITSASWLRGVRTVP